MPKVQVKIMGIPFSFVGDDEERIKKVANWVDGRVSEISKRRGIVSTLNAFVMALMEIADEYMEMKERQESYEKMTTGLLDKLRDFEGSLRCA